VHKIESGESTETDQNGNQIIHIQRDILLQKWNNITMNYQGGTLDIFYNGKLVKSSAGVVQFATPSDNLSIGDTDGINAQINNLIYFNNPMSLIQISELYNLVKMQI
jgi:hypothetical protein